MHALRGDADTDRHADLVSWRSQYLTRAGLDTPLVAQVAGDLRWDLHALLELVERGCPSGLAARILEPDAEEEGPRG